MLGEIVAERFQIESLAGKGGMGVVYRALDLQTKKIVAIKLISKATLAFDRFLREAQILSALSHPGIVSYIAHGQIETGQPYLAMEWLDGEELTARLSRGLFSVEEALQLMLSLAEALSVAHAQGVIHRDIKPQNIFLVRSGSSFLPKLLDFGIARPTEASLDLTATGVLMGTPGYIAPEQATLGAKHLTASADIFALGCVLFECLAGRPAFFGGNILAILSKILLEETPKLSELRSGIPVEVEQLVKQMLSKDPMQRPRDGAELLQCLQTLTPTTTQATKKLTHKEQRFLSVLLVDLFEELQQESVTLTSIREQGDLFGAKLFLLLDGSLLLTFSGAHTAADQALRAGRVALELRPLFPDARMCIATGRSEAAEQRAPIGDVIEEASRQQRLAAPRDIRVDRVTAGLLASKFTLLTDQDGAVLRSYKASGERLLFGRLNPCVGRERELLLIESAVEHCLSEEESKAILITAMAGVGKSALREELLRRFEAQELRPLFFAQGDPIRAGAPFGLLAPALRQAFGLPEDAPKLLYPARIRERLAPLLPTKDLERVVVFLCAMLTVFVEGSPLQERLLSARRDPQLMADQTRRAFIDWLRAEAARAPVLIVIEDLHWGDLPTVKFIEAALRELSGAPLIVLAFARPTVHDHFPGLWLTRSVEELKLPALSKKACQILCRQALGEAPPSLMTQLFERSGGNAFYLEELLRALRVGGELQQLPQTVLAMASSRLEELPDNTRRTLRAASVFGERFWISAVASLIEDGTDALPKMIQELVDIEVLVECPESKFPKEQEYRFRHAFFQEAAYAALINEDRVLAHRLAARWLLEAGEQSDVVLGEHFERGEEPERAAPYYVAAAGQALDGNDLEAAINLATRALSCGARGVIAGEAQILLGRTFWWRGESAKSDQHNQSALSLLTVGTNSWLKAIEIMGLLGSYTNKPERLGAVPALLEQARVSDDNRESYIIAAGRNAVQGYITQRHELADELYEGAQQQIQQGDAGSLTHAVLSMASAFQAAVSGDLSRSVNELESSAAYYQAAGDLRNSASQLVDAALWHSEFAPPDEVFARVQALLPSLERLGVERLVWLAYSPMARALTELGQPEAALEKLNLALKQSFNATSEAQLRLFRIYSLLELGRLKEAEEDALLGSQLLGAFSLAFQAVASGVLSKVYLAQKRYEEALDLAKHASTIHLSEGPLLKTSDAAAFLVQTEALLALGQREAAREAAKIAKDRLLWRASKLSDPDARASILCNLKEHRRIMSLAEELSS